MTRKAESAPENAAVEGMHSVQDLPDRHFEILRQVIPAVVSTLGEGCEVVLHDFRRPERSIVGIAGSVTGRSVGDSVTQIGLALIAQGDSAPDVINYTTKTSDGRTLRSSTTLLRDADSHVFGAFCINLAVESEPTRTATSEPPSDLALPPDINFSGDLNQVLIDTIEHELTAQGDSAKNLPKAARQRIVDDLAVRGVFSIRHSVPLAADRLRVSRATIYSDLEELGRSTKPDQPPTTVRKGRSS